MKYYLVGIKGSGMSALALILNDLGHEVRGADVNQTIFTEYNLKEKNIIIDSLNDMHYENYDTIVIGNAFIDKYDFNDKSIKTYQEMLSILNDKYYSIAVCGTHGKTTITNMIKHVLSQEEKIIYLVGDGQGKADKNAKYFVYEACEHRDHFLSYHPNIIVCSNVDYDHVEYFNSKAQYKKSFQSFFNQCKDYLILNESISYKKNKLYYGINKGNVKAFNVRYLENGTMFNLIYNHKTYKDIRLPIYGKHMLSNTLACISCCLKLNIKLDNIIDYLKTYKNASRRYNITLVNSNVIIDDYGHHPREINATINAIKQEFYNKELIIVYHPDRPKRLTTFLNDYIKVFKQAKTTYALPFLKNSVEEQIVLSKLINNKNIFLFNDSFYNFEYYDTVFLFTGSKEMKTIINKLIHKL